MEEMQITTIVKLKKPNQFSQIELSDSWSDNDESMEERKKQITDDDDRDGFLDRVKNAFKNQIDDLEMSDLIIKQ